MPKASPGSKLAAMRKQIAHVCPQPCGKKFKAIATAKYCSNRCRQRVKNDKAKATKK